MSAPGPDAQQAAQTPVSRPSAAPVDSGAIGRLNEGPCARCGTDDDTCCITIGGGGPHCCEACRATDGRTHPKPEGVGTGAGEGAPRQDTGSAWVTRSTDCPEAPAQAHPLVGRLSERQTVDALLACLPMHEDGTGHVADCGYDWDATTRCGCYTLPDRLAAIVREHTDRALADAWDEGYRRGELDGTYQLAVAAGFRAPAPRSCNPYRAARQEQS